MGRVYVIRHGQTNWNEQGIMHGQSDIPLNARGFVESHHLAEQLKDKKIDICFCSPLIRAYETARVVLKYHKAKVKNEIFIDDRLMELYKGKLEGSSNNSELMMKDETLELLQKYDIESKAHFYKRIAYFYDEILPKYVDKNILVVGHSGTVKMSEFYFNPPEKDIVSAYYDYHIGTCELREYNYTHPIESRAILKEYDVDRKEYPLI